MYFLTEKNLTTTGDVAELGRALELPPGEYTLYVAMRERQPKDRKQQPKTVVLAQPLTVPDMNTGLTTSSVILAKSLDPAPEQLTGQQQLEQPFTISGYRVVPSFGAPIPQSGELMFVFFIYNEGVAASGKPDLDVDYLFYRANRRQAVHEAGDAVVQRDDAAGAVRPEAGPSGVRRPGNSGEGCVQAGRISAGNQGDRQDQQSDDYAERAVHRVVVEGYRPSGRRGAGVMTRWIPAAAIAAFVLGAPAAYAQALEGRPLQPQRFPAGSIEGRVLDDSNSPVVGAMVSVVGRTTAAATTDRDGRYTLRELPYGPYILSVHSRGYFKSRGRTVQLTTSKISIPEIQLQRASAEKAPVASSRAGGRRAAAQ